MRSASSAEIVAADNTSSSAFATLPGFVAYCGALPRQVDGALRHVWRGEVDEEGDHPECGERDRQIGE